MNIQKEFSKLLTSSQRGVWPINIPLIALILQGIPETVGVVTLAFVIAKLSLDWRKIVLIGSALAFGVYFLRLFPIAFGIHTIFQVVLLFIALIWICKGDLSLSLIASLLSFLALAMFEFISLSILMPIFGLTLETLFIDPFKRIIFGQPIVLLLFSSAFLLNRRSRMNELLRKH